MSSGPLRVAQVITGLQTGGAETMLLRLVERLDRSRFEPVVVSLTQPGTIGPRIAKLGVEVVSSGAARTPTPRDLRRIRDDIAAAEPDLVQTWTLYGNVLGGIAARAARRAPVVWGVHHSGDDLPQFGRRVVWTQGIERRLARVVPARIVACSQSSRRMLDDFGYPQRKLTTILNGFDLSRFHPDASARETTRTELGIEPSVPVVGQVARFHPVKGHDLMAEAARQVAGCDPEVRFVLCGSGVDVGNPELGRLLEPIRERVILLGERSDLERIYPALDVCVSSSSAEALPLAVGEAMSAGVPVAATDAGDSADMIGDTGRVVPLRDAAALAGAICKLIALPEARRRELGTAARRRIERLYSLDGMVEAYMRLWAEVVARASSRS